MITSGKTNSSSEFSQSLCAYLQNPKQNQKIK